MKKIFVLIACIACFSQMFGQKEIIDKVVAMVGGELILLSDIEEQKALAESQQGGVPENARCLILDNIMGSKLLVNQARLDSILVSEEEVEAQLNARIDQILQYMGGSVEQFEAYYGMSVNEVKAQFREDLEGQLLAERMQQQIIAGVNVTPSEVKAFFNRIPKDSLPYFNSEVEVGEIIIKPEVNEVEKAKALAKAEEVLKMLTEDEMDFAVVAQKYSMGPSGAAGGDLGWTKRGSFVPEFEATAYNLDENEISEITETEFGFHIIQLLGRRGNTINTRHILITPEITDEDMAAAEAKLKDIRRSIASDSISFSKAVKRYGNDEVQSYNNDGRLVNPASGNTFFEIGDLEPDVYFTIDTMEIGGVSNPFTYKDPRGEAMYRIIQLQSRTVPHKANLATDYSKIRDAAIQEKKNIYINDWIDSKINATYIQVDDMFGSCDNLIKWTPEKAKN